jgi:hypothetical protein
MSTARIVVSVGLVLVGSLCGLIGSMVGAEMQGAVNQRVPQLEHFEAPWWAGKQLRLMREHWRQFPRSKLRTIQLSLAAITFVCLAGLAFVIGIL